MTDLSQLIDELISASDRLKMCVNIADAGDSVGHSKIEREVLEARVSGLVQASLKVANIELPVYLVEERQGRKLLELVDTLIPILRDTLRYRVTSTDQGDYLGELVSRALWKSKEIKYSMGLIAGILVFSLGLLGLGVGQINDKTTEAQATINRSLQLFADAKESLEKGERLKDRMSEEFKNYQDFVNGADFKVKDIEFQIKQFESESEHKINRIDVIAQNAQEYITRKMEQSVEVFNAEISTKNQLLEQKIKLMNSDMDDLDKKVNGLKSSAQEIADSLVEMNSLGGKYLKLKNTLDNLAIDVGALDEQADLTSIISAKKIISSRLAELNLAIEELNESKTKVGNELTTLSETSFRLRSKNESMDDQLAMIEDIRAQSDLQKREYNSLQTNLEEMVAKFKVISSLSESVDDRIEEVMALSSDKIADSLIRVMDEQRWLLVISIVGGVLFFVLFVWIIFITNYMRSKAPLGHG